jgi:hypothetical protein
MNRSLKKYISLAIQRGNAASIRGTFPDSAILSDIFVPIIKQKCYFHLLIFIIF